MQSTWCYAGQTSDERHAQLTMRLIGHEFLLSRGDSTSRVLPIEKEAGRYRISFDRDLEFVPDELSSVVDSIMKAIDLASSYTVEVEDCDSGTVVYGYERNAIDTLDIMACGARALPIGCYQVLLEIHPSSDPNAATELGSQVGSDSTEDSGRTFPFELVLFALAGVLTVLFFRRKGTRELAGANETIHLGQYRFDKRNMKLLLNDRETDLTSKESDLLFLLYSSANNTVQREVMLKEVWGNDGDYIGRTLDVFISKLRKKLEDDPSVRIANIRGVGYKLILNP